MARLAFNVPIFRNGQKCLVAARQSATTTAPNQAKDCGDLKSEAALHRMSAWSKAEKARGEHSW
jgi:hypothetical protein